MKASKQTRLKLRNGFHKAPISYRVLMISQFSAIDNKEVSKGLALAITPEKAKELLPRPGKQTKWKLIQNSSVGLCGTYDVQQLLYKGLEVAVFWKRQTSEVIPDPSDPVPEGILENPDDVWARLDLFHKSARQMVGVVGAELNTLRSELASKDAQIQAQKRIKQADDKTIETLQGTISSLEAKQKKANKENRNGKAK
jgi:hypothetical protein